MCHHSRAAKQIQTHTVYSTQACAQEFFNLFQDENKNKEDQGIISVLHFQFGQIGQSESENVEDVEGRLLSTQPSGGEYQRSLERLCCATAKAHDLPSGAGDRKHVEGEGRM